MIPSAVAPKAPPPEIESPLHLLGRAQRDEVTEHFLELKERVLARRPVLREILAEHGEKPLYEYARGYASQPTAPIERREEFLATFHDEVAQRLGTTVAARATAHLRAQAFVSTADHHGPICYAFFLNANLLTAAPYTEMSGNGKRSIIVLACANVSLNNSSYPRGLLFHSGADGALREIRLPFTPASTRLSPVYNYPSYTMRELIKTKRLLGASQADGSIDQGTVERITALLDDLYAAPDVLAAPNFADQVTTTNFHLWQRFFRPHHAEPADLVYLEQEGLVARLLLAHHLDRQTTLQRMLFDPKAHAAIARHFEGIMGAFSLAENWGTFLFWGLPSGSKYRVRLWKRGNELVSENGSWRVALTPDALRRGLETKELIPSMLLTYATLAFYYGITCLGGFSQVNYLTRMKEGYLALLRDLDDAESMVAAAQVETKELGGDFTFAYVGGRNGTMVPATGIDLLLYSTPATWPAVIELAKRVTLTEAFLPMLPELYTILHPETERSPHLSALTAGDIARLIGLERKLQPVVSV